MVAIAACKKGDTGPKGDAGAQGAPGAAGPKGTANVIYSAWISTNPWAPSTTSTGTGKATYYYDIASTKVTQGIIDSGTVLVYAKFVADPDGNGIAKLLPSIYYNVGGATTQFRFQHGLLLNTIRVICDVVPTGIPNTSNQVRYVIIPGGTPASGRSMTMSDYSKMSYEEVCRLYNIPE
ncbi:hypothetical protein D3H65_27610 [Paraflavitalea soli]|uniref:Collagen-like protein n=2 Tax=Paraflavitalea soli TaxID=2315862 RepID=A0A3B7N638_9BACT|nr:hypothetical protein D3H65_27610 [Paraflavitalea soli]